MAKDILRNRYVSVKSAKENNMEWFGIVALLLLLCYSAYPGKVKRLETKVKRLEKKQRGVKSMDYNSQKRIKTKIQSGSYSKGDLQWSFGFLC